MFLQLYLSSLKTDYKNVNLFSIVLHSRMGIYWLSLILFKPCLLMECFYKFRFRREIKANDELFFFFLYLFALILCWYQANVMFSRYNRWCFFFSMSVKAVRNSARKKACTEVQIHF